MGLRTHSTRGLASSWALFKDITLQEVCEAACWATSSYFWGFTDYMSLHHWGILFSVWEPLRGDAVESTLALESMSVLLQFAISLSETSKQLFQMELKVTYVTCISLPARRSSLEETHCTLEHIDPMVQNRVSISW